MRHMRAVLLTSALCCLLAGCGKKPPSDQAITTDIQAKLYADPATKAANITVAVSGGAVTLSGGVPTSDVELAAMKIANGTNGVRSVKDQMTVNAAAASNPDQSQAPAPAAAPAQTAPAQPPAPATAVAGQAARSYPPISGQPAQPQAPAQSTAPPPIAAAPSAPERRPVVLASITLPIGTRVSVRMIDSIDSAHNTTGQVFRASLDSPILSRGRVVIPAGSTAAVLLAAARSAGHIKGESELEVRLSALDYHGRSYPVSSSIYEETGKARGKQSAVRTGVGAVAGAVIGAIAGGGRGAAIGTVAGGGAGAGYQLFTHGQQVKIPSETLLSFRLEAPLTIEERR